MKAPANKKKFRISHFSSRRLAELLKPHRSGWVALSPDEQRIVASGKTLHETRERAMSSQVSDAVFVKVIPQEQGYLPHLQ